MRVALLHIPYGAPYVGARISFTRRPTTTHTRDNSGNHAVSESETFLIFRTVPILPHTTSAVSAFPEADVRSTHSVCV